MSKTGRPSGGNGETNRAFHEILGPERSAVIVADVVAAMKSDQRERFEAAKARQPWRVECSA